MCGYSNWGKSYTLYEMFNKKNFQPEKVLYKQIKFQIKILFL